MTVAVKTHLGFPGTAQPSQRSRRNALGVIEGVGLKQYRGIHAHRDRKEKAADACSGLFGFSG